MVFISGKGSNDYPLLTWVLFASLAMMFGKGLTKLNWQLLFQESFIPVSVNSTSSSVPNQLQSVRSISTWPLSSALATKIESFSSKCSQVAMAFFSVPKVTCSVTIMREDWSTATSNTLMTNSDLTYLSFLRYLGSSMCGYFRILMVTAILVSIWFACQTE